MTLTTALAPLDGVIRQALTASQSTDPDALTDDVLAEIAPSDYGHYLRQAIRLRLAPIASRLRTEQTPDVRKGISTKQSLIRDGYWPSFLRQRIFLPDGAKFLSQATADDLRYAAEDRRSRAAEMTFRAEQFEALAALMDEAQVECLEQLDAEVATKTLGRAA